jgi:hypothetical protein
LNPAGASNFVPQNLLSNFPVFENGWHGALFFDD